MKAIRERRTPRRTFSILATIGLVTGMASFTLLFAPAASAVPRDPNAVAVPVQCDGGTWVTYLHPGIGAALWDVTTEDVTNAPNALIKSIDQDVYVNGEFIGTFHYSNGNMTGLGEADTCTYYESFTDRDGNFIEIYGTSHHVSTKVPT